MLVGGHGHRLGGLDKARLRLPSSPPRTLLEQLVATLGPSLHEVFLVGRSGQRFPEVPCRFVADRRSGLGPLAALEAALSATTTPWCFLVACDLPALTVELVERLAAGRDQRTDVVIFATPAGLEPTAALYHRRLAPAVSAALETGERALHAFAARQTCRRLRLPDALAPQLVNLNTPEDCRNVLPPR